MYPYDYQRQPDFIFGQPGSPFGPFGQIFGQTIPGSQFLPGGGPPSIPPPGAGASSEPPPGPPPSFVPSQAMAQSLGGPSAFAVDPGAIRPCIFRYVYIWLENGRQFWAWLVFVGRNSVAGWRWTGFNWSYFGTDLRNIDSFVCY